MNTPHAPVRLMRLTLALAALGLALASTAQAQLHTEPPEHLDCATMNCAGVLPGALRFEAVEGAPYVAGLDADGETVGWVAMSTDLVDVMAYSGKPLVTLVGLNVDGEITAAEVIHHSEPILLVGIPFSALQEFVANYRGVPATTRVVVGTTTDESAMQVDSISGATVTALAENQTILETARTLGTSVGVLDAEQMSGGHFVEYEGLWSWQRMTQEGLFGRLRVTEAEMGVGDSDASFVNLWFAIVDPPHIGRSLLGDRTYEHLQEQLEPGQHLFVILGSGSSSFKGSAFVRGGIFDRVRVDQGLNQITFRDTDYENLNPVRAEGAPRFREGAVFITRGGRLDPGRPFDLVFLGSRYDGRGAFTREFHEFRGTFQLPPSIYFVPVVETEAIWVQAWRNRKYDVVALVLLLLWVTFVFVARRWSTAKMLRLERLHLVTQIVSLAGVGFYMHAQPSVTQVMTLVDSLLREWRWELFFTEPLIFIFWVWIFLTSLWWGRGLFCGWLCPYGVLSELTRKIAAKLGVKERELPDSVHRWARYLRYALLVALVPIFLYDSILGEMLAEVEPFKSTFFVPLWEREWFFIAWWGLLFVASIFTYRPFCRYLCPLGGALALMSSFRPSGPRRRNFCSSCKICTRGCEPKAIRPNGTIDPRECLSCMECEANYRDEQVCPPLIGTARLLAKAKRSEQDNERLAKLKVDRERV